MATLSLALNYAVAGLSVASAQSALASRNVAGANDPDYNRRTADVITLPGGAPSIGPLTRSADKRLLEKLQDMTSSASGKQVDLDALQALSEMIGDPSSETSVAALVARLQTSLKDAEVDPGSFALAAELVDAARTLTGALNSASEGIQKLRQAADAEVASSAGRINSLLAQFKVANDAVVRGSGTPSELADSLDQRDRILKQLSEELGIRTVTRQNNDIAIYTDGGVTLFETSARQVAFTPTAGLAAGAPGGRVTVDGIDIAAKSPPMTSTTGKLQAHLAVRDQLTTGVQSQLDEIARGMVDIFAERGSDGSLGPAEGLIVSGLASPPSPGVLVPGLAASVRVNAMADTNPFLVRDGGFGGAAFGENVTGAASYQARLGNLQQAFDNSMPFAAEAKLGTAASLKSFAAAANGWLNGQLSQASADAESAQAQQVRTEEALSRLTGVNIDEEMASILDLEKSYQASAKVIAAVDSMLAALFQAVG